MATEVTQKWTFGTPSLISNNNSKAEWFKSGTSPYYQKSPNGYLAKLYGGLQTGDDWAGVFIPVNELSLRSFAEAQWSYYMSATDTMGVNIVIWVHDPDDFDKRAEITQLGGHADLEKAAGWNAHEFTSATGGMFFYGENTTGTGLTAGTQYLWSQFIADALFKTWTIYRISFEFGWQASGTFGTAWLADVKLNQKVILLGPADGKHKNTVITTKTLEAEGAYSADDVISESDTASAGTDWDFEMGGTGYITKAVIAHATNANTARVHLFLYSRPPTCELDDHAASNGPVAADIPYFLGVIEFPAMTDTGTGHSYATVTSSTVGNLPLAFDTPIIYGVAVTKDAIDFADDTLLSIILTGDMEDN